MTNTVLIIDLEATCWERRTEVQQNEIIEIGSVLVRNQEIIYKHSWFVRPILNPKLSDFCKALTSITQEEIDTAETFPIVIEQFKSAVESAAGELLQNLVFLSWGNYDRKQFVNDCNLHKVPYPFGQHVNLKEKFAEKFKVKKCGVPKALKHLNLDFIGTHHRGIDDATNIAKIFIKALTPMSLI